MAVCKLLLLVVVVVAVLMMVMVAEYSGLLRQQALQLLSVQ
jgi:hypothetical protein